WKAAEKLVASGWLNPSDEIVMFNTGSGLKYNHLASVSDLPVLDHHDPACLQQVRLA
ncbi:MAG: hypothetical protein JSS02_26035, partial [Planctomycetes bacterium]|nr:hypothetical protein [Planctomycetota bacterium]